MDEKTHEPTDMEDDGYAWVLLGGLSAVRAASGRHMVCPACGNRVVVVLPGMRVVTCDGETPVLRKP